jgi:hypothetical protein
MKVCSIFSQVLKLFSRGGVREGGQAAQGRTARAGLHELGPVHRHVVLPGGKGAFPARDLWGTCMLRCRYIMHTFLCHSRSMDI